MHSAPFQKELAMACIYKKIILINIVQNTHTGMLVKEFSKKFLEAVWGFQHLMYEEMMWGLSKALRSRAQMTLFCFWLLYPILTSLGLNDTSNLSSSSNPSGTLLRINNGMERLRSVWPRCCHSSLCSAASVYAYQNKVIQSINYYSGKYNSIFYKS